MARIRTAFAVSVLGVALATDPLAAQEAPPGPLAAADTGDWTSGAYKYDGAGNIVQIGTSQSPNTEGRPNHYIYDLRGQLVEGTANTAAQNNTQAYTYDVYGNLTKVITNGNTVSMGIDATTNHIDKPEACVAGSTCVTGTFDSAGNQTSSSTGYTWKYDALSAMSELSGPQGRHEAYLYDDLGERVAVVADGGTADTAAWRYTIRGVDRRVWREYADVVTGGQHSWRWVQDYVHRGGSLLATYKASGSGELTQHFHLDHLGTPRIITDGNGRRIATRTYMPYGDEAPGSSFDGEVMKFTGHERDIAPDGSVNSLDYMHARYYGAIQARFLSVDPVQEIDKSMRRSQSWNRYSYALNNPMVFADPTGKTVYLVTFTLGNAEGDDDFRRAARTRANEIRSQKGFDPRRDKVLVRGVVTKADFQAAVAEANALAPKFGQVGELSMFSHAGPRDGPIFQQGVKGQAQFTRGELKAMSVNWEAGGSARFYGCNTGINFSQRFANAQGVRAYGYEGFAGFSGTERYYTAPTETGPLYLIYTTGWSNDGLTGYMTKHFDENVMAIPMDPDDPVKPPKP